MSFLKNTVSLLALLCVMPAANAATARPSVLNAANVRRMPTLATYTGATTGTAGTVTSGTTTAATLLANAECIDAYTACIKGGDACGSNFEECTTNVLFHGKMPLCLSTLSQCESAGVNSLFGTSNISALSNVATKNTYGEITEYTYPTAGSVLGQMISAAAIENMYDTSNCVRRYSSCLRKDSVCGADFELCTTNAEFKKQAVFCDSTLARCAGEGKNELFGNAGATSSTVPTASSRIGEMIAEGAALAAVNAVSTCYKVVDQCILNACATNPYKCYENATAETVAIVDAINNGTEITGEADTTAVVAKSNISSYIQNACLDTIGSNKYCYATFISDGVMPTASQLRDEDNQAEVYDLAYSARMNSGMRAKIAELVNKFDTRAKEKCVNTIKSCAMRTCGGGSGAACYAQVFGATDKSINNEYTRNEIRTGCLSVVNTDANCKYAAQNPNSTGTYTYSFMDADAFDVLFPEYDGGAESDPIGVVASLNASLANNYSDAAIAQMKKRCQSIATSCVKSMCGADYVNCYRNRTDIYSSLTNSGDANFDKSMNKVGGVLDYTIVLGLCVDTVKNADVCSEHLAIEANKLKIANNTSAGSWGTGSVRSDWIDAGATSAMTENIEQVAAIDENGNKLCESDRGNQGVCDTTDTATGEIFDKPVMLSYTTYIESQAASTLFKDLIYDLEIEAQAKYNAKLTKQQNMCMSSNNGGIMGNRDMGSTFMWAKLKSNKVPANYATAGLKTNQFVASNDLYGSFCRVRVTLQSDDKRIQDAINNGADWATAYFAAGDAFTCGSWISNDKLQELATAAGEDARADAAAAQPKIKGWLTALGAIGGGAGGAYLGAGIQKGDVFGGLSGKKSASDKTSSEDLAKQCKNLGQQAVAELGNTSAGNAEMYLNGAINIAKKLDVDDKYINAARDSLKSAKQKVTLEYFYPELAEEANSKCFDKDCFDRIVSGADPTFNKTHDEEYAYFKGSWKQGDPVRQNRTSVVLVSNFATAGAYDYTEASNAIKTLVSACEVKGSSTTDKKGLSTGAAAGIGAGVGAIAGGILANQVVNSIQNAELDTAQQAAINEFMDNVGSKIRCFIGADEVGMYGDMISTSME